MSEQKFLWTDVETSGLDLDKNNLLEVAVVATDNKLNILGEYKAVIKCNNFDDMNDFVTNMHTNNGLIEECKKSKLTLKQVETHLIAFLDELKLTEKPIMAGNSVHFDKYFIAKKMPDFNQLLHYRLLDVSTIKELMRNFYGIKLPKDDGNHRASHDVYASIEEFRKYSSILKVDMLGY